MDKRRPLPLKTHNAAMAPREAAQQLPGLETSSRAQVPSAVSPVSPPSEHPTRLKEFAFAFTDYELESDQEPLGAGAWSMVYLAHPKPQYSSLSASASMPPTPPVTPVKHFASLAGHLATQSYAVKIPSSRSCRDVILSEARILSHITSLSGGDEYLVPFYGYDVRNGAIIMQALPQSVEGFTLRALRGLDAATRTQKLASVFPDLALRLLRGLDWLHGNGVVHADIKPGNILLKPTADSSADTDTITDTATGLDEDST